MKSSKETEQALSLRGIFARNVRLVRTHAHLSQEGMADLAELDRAFVGTLERGTRNISIDNIERIAKALNEAPHELMRPDLPLERGLDPELIRSPRTTRLYPVERQPRKIKAASTD
jgi:transcriptional regulator with XRE-family HTH domain